MGVTTYKTADLARLDGFLTKAAIAEHFGVSRQSVSKWVATPGFPLPDAVYTRGSTEQPLWSEKQVVEWRKSLG